MEKTINMDYFRKLVQDILCCSDGVEIAEEIGRESDKHLEECEGFYEFLFRAIKEISPDISYDWNPIVEHFDLEYYKHAENPKLQFANDFVLYKIEVLDPTTKVKRKINFGFPKDYLDLMIWIFEELTNEINFLKDKSKAQLFATILCVDHINKIKQKERNIELGCSTAQFAYCIYKLTDLFKLQFNSILLSDVKIIGRNGKAINSGYLNKEISFQKEKPEVFDGWRHKVYVIFKIALQKFKNN